MTASDVSESSVSGAKHVVAFKNHMFYSGMSGTPQEVVFSEPFDEDGFNASDGAGSIKVDDTIVGLKVFRDMLGGSRVADAYAEDIARGQTRLEGFATAGLVHLALV